MKIHYQEHSIESVLSYFTNGFKMKKNTTLARYEWFYDPHKGQVIFKLYIEDKPASRARAKSDQG